VTDIARLNDHQLKISVKESQTGKTCSMIVTLDEPNVSFEVLTERRRPFHSDQITPHV
jgi:hypothetical protein